MYRLKRNLVIGVVFVFITGTLAHFLYEWTGNSFFAGLFTPVSESVWEHMKLLFFPMLFYSLPLTIAAKGSYGCLVPSLCFGILAGTLLIPVLFYAYTFILGKNILVLDIAIFALSTVLAFWTAYRLTLSCRLKPYTGLLCALVCILFLCFLLFTYSPPDMEIFIAPAAARI